MFRNSRQGLHAVRIAGLVFASLLIAAVAAPLEASGVTNLSEESRPNIELVFSDEVAAESPLNETFRVHIWIPGFDDVEPVVACLPMPTSNHPSYRVVIAGKLHFGKLARVDACSGMLRMLPWIWHSAPKGREQFLLPMI